MQDGIIFGKIFAGLVTLAVSLVGLIVAMKPKLFMTHKIKANKTKVDLTITPTPGAMIIYRIVGFVFFVAGLMLFLVAITSRW